MKLALLSRFSCAARGYALLIICLMIFFGSGTMAQEASKESLQLLKVSEQPLNTGVQRILVVTPNSAYSNVTNFSGGALANGGAATAPNIMTRLIADGLHLIGAPPYSISSFRFSIANIGPGSVSARPLVRFYQANGTGGGPGTLITGVNFNAVTLAASTVTLLSASTPVNLPVADIWAGITFDNNTGATGATAEQMNGLSQGIFNPIDVGTSADNFFASADTGRFIGDNPAGNLNTLTAGGPANFGWEFVSSTALPVTVEYFKGNRNANSHNITWKVNCVSTPKAIFSLEQSKDSKEFKNIYSLTATAVRCLQPFNFEISNPFPGLNYYRLKTTDADGKTSYSSIISLLNRESGFQITSLFPNPMSSNGMAVLNIASARSGSLKISVYDAAGKKLREDNEAVTAGSNQLQMNFLALPAGKYAVRVINETGQVQSAGFIKR